MADKTYICPKCKGTQHDKSKCKQCGIKVVELDEWLESEEAKEWLIVYW